MEAEEDQSAQVQGQPGRRPRWVARRRSGVYEHFTCFRDDDGNNRARCNRCQLVLGASTRYGTSTLLTHVRICWGEEAVAAARRAPRPPVPAASPSHPTSSLMPHSSCREPAGLDDEDPSKDLARMIALHGHDPSVVEDDYFRSFVRRLNPAFELPSRDDIEDMCCDMFGCHRWDLFLSCLDAPGRLSFAVGTAKTMEAGQVLYATCQFIDDEWNLHNGVEYAYVVLPPGDPNLGSSFFGIPAVSRDDVVERFVADLCKEYGDCTLFIMARGMTGDIDYGELKDHIEKKLGSDSPPTNRELICTTETMDHVLHSIARCLLPHPDFQQDIMSDLDYPKGIFEVRRECAQHGLDDPWEYDEHWYWCYFSLEILHQQGKIHTGSSELLHSLWKVIHRAIKRVSDSCHPTSNLCLEQLFMVRYALKYQLSNATTAHAGEYSGFGEKNVADVLKEALETVDKAIQDSYLVWSIPHVLDPRYKLRSIEDNFKRAFGPDDAFNYTSSIREKLKELYITNYIENDNDMEEDDDEVFDASIEEMVDDSSTTPLEQSRGDSLAAKTELDHYLQDNPARRTKDFDILIWWKVYGSVQYPTVARMARDALAMPTCSKLTSDQMAHVRSLLCGYEATRDSFSSSAMDKASDQIAHIKSLVRGYEAKRDSFSSSAMDKAKTIEEDEEMEESSQGKAKAADRPNQERTVIGHGNTTMDDPPSQVQGNRNEWVLDTTVWVHHTFNLRLLCDLTTYNLVEVANMLPPEGQDCRLPVRGCGSVDTEDFAIPDVSYIQGESRNVISVSQLARSHDLVTVFEPTRCYVMDKLSRKIVGEGRLRNGAYVMDYLRISQDGGGRAGGQEREGKQEEGRGGSGGGHFGGGKNDGGGVQGRGGSEAGGGADGGSGGGGGDKDKDKDKEGRKDQDIKEEDKEENEEEGKEEKEETGKEEETKGGGEDITEEEHQQLSQVPQGMFGLSQSESVGTVPTTSHVFVTPTQRNPDFIFDSGACFHVTYFPLNQGDFKAYPSHLNITPPTQSIMGVDGGCLGVYGIGYLENPENAIDYVLYVPGSFGNCVSVAQLLKDYNLRAEFYVPTFEIVQRLTGVIVGSGKMKGNQYVLDRFQAGRLVQTN